MGRMKELSQEIDELRHCGEILIDVSETLRKMFTETGSTEPETAEMVAADTEADRKAEQASASEPATVPEGKLKPVKLSEVRTVLAEKSRKGFTADVRELLKKYGAEKLSEVDPAKYADLKADAEVLGDG